MSPTPKFIEDVLINNNNNKDKSDKWVFPYQITRVDEKTNKELLAYFTGEKTGFVQVGPEKWFFPSGYEREAQNYYNFEARPDDIFVVTFPRSGTTWMQEMVWLLANNLNYNKAAETPLDYRCPFLEFSCFVHKETKEQFLSENAYDEEKYQQVQNIDYPGWKTLAKMSGQRFIKTHLPFSLLPPNILEVGCKVIYVARNPKDVAVSFYHLNRLIRTQGYVGDFAKYWDFFERNLQPWTPYWKHIEEGWSRRNETNLLFLFYEDLNKNLRDNVGKVSEFLGNKYTSQQYAVLEDHLSIDNFRKNKSVNSDINKRIGIMVSGEENFVRKGKTGGWKDYFDDTLNARADKWIAENLKNTDLTFPSI